MDVKKHTRATCAQVAATSALFTTNLNAALIIGMPVFVIGALRQQDAPFKLTEEEASWLGGLMFMVKPLGSVISGFSQDILGRKTCLILATIPQAMGWLTLYFASSVYMLFASNFLMGLSMGFLQTPAVTYSGEVTEPRLRGILGSISGIFSNIGFIIISVVGAVTDWRTMSLMCAGAPVVSLLLLTMIPESPAWLASKDRVEDARKAYQWLRGWVPPQAVQEELDVLVAYVKKSHNFQIRYNNNPKYHQVAIEEDKNSPSDPVTTKESQLKIFMHPSIQKPFRLIIIFFIVSTCSALIAVRPFFVEIVVKMKMPLKPQVAILVFTLLTTVASLMSTVLMRRLGKRVLTFLSLGPCVVSCLGLGIYLQVGLTYPWIPTVLFGISYFAPGLGAMSIPWILISEVFPLKGKSIASGMASAIGFLWTSIVIKTYFNVMHLVGEPGLYFLYGTVGALGICFLYFNLPETEGMALKDIEDFFNGDKNNDVRNLKNKTRK